MSFEEWKEYKIGDLYDVFSGLSKPREQFGFGHPFLTFKDVFNNYFLPERLESLANTNEKEIRSCSIKKGDVFLTRTSETQNELGMSSVALKDYENATFNGFTKRLRLKKDIDVKIDLKYLGYFLRSPFFRSQISQHSSLTTRASLNSTSINSLKIYFPALNIQERIGSILKCLDDKIELNRKANQTLEAIAQAIFKEWFVDFNFPGATGEMQDSELGEIPRGWRVGKLTDVAEVNPKLSIKKGSLAKYVEMKDLSQTAMSIDRFIEREFLSGSKFQNGDTLLARITPCLENGKTGYVDFLHENEIGWGSTEFIVLRSKSTSPYFIYCLARLNAFREFAIMSMVGSSGRQRVVESILCDFPFVVPAKELIELFDKTMKPLFQNIKNNHEQTKTLTQLRDSLLPKLMKGEISLDNKNN